MADRRINILETLAHDLRGPLSPLQTAVYLLRQDRLDPGRQAELLDIIDRQTARLSDMFQEVADWNRAEQGRLINHRETTGLSALLDLARASSARSSIPSGREATLDVQLDPAVHEAGIAGDTQRLVQMFASLLAYARAGAAGGGVRVTGQRVAGNRAWVCVRADDAGPAQDAVGDLFSSPQAAPFDEGLGLRLMIAEAIAEAHGGRLSAAVSDAGGSELLIELPIAG